MGCPGEEIIPCLDAGTDGELGQFLCPGEGIARLVLG